jgi:5-amino-6-(5-phospho-D-ribitylamino)uracil phosphatase
LSTPYRLIAIDLDGTLLDPRGVVTPRTKQAIHRCLQAGILVCFATGRNWTESRMVLDAVGHYASAVFAGGALIVDTEKQVILHRMKMDATLAARICGLFERNGQCALALQDIERTGLDYLVSQHIPMNRATRDWMDFVRPTVRQVTDLRSPARHEHTIRVSICADPSDVADLSRQVAAEFDPASVLVLSMHVPTYGVDIMEVFDPAINKWNGVLQVAQRHGITPDQIVAIGDDINDVPMLRGAGLGVAMGNATPMAKAAADRVIGTNTDEGLAQFLEALLDQHLVSRAE